MSYCRIFVLCSFLILAAAENGDSGKGPSHGKIVICRTSMAEIAAPAKDGSDIIQANLLLCTHLSVENIYPETSDKRVDEIRRKFPHLKIHAGFSFEEMLKSYMEKGKQPEVQKQYVKNIVDQFKAKNLNGMDLFCGDMKTFVGKYPQFDKMQELLKLLKETINDPDFKVSMTISATEEFFSSDFGLGGIVADLDLVNVMPEPIGAESVIEDARKELHIKNGEKMLKLLIDFGIPSEKLIMGFHLGGSRFRPATKKWISDVAYKMFCGRKKSDTEWEKTYDSNSSLATIQSTNYMNQTTVFMNSRSIANRLRSAIKLGLAGASVDSLLSDDINGACELEKDTFDDFDASKVHIPKRDNGKYPLLKTINEAIAVTLEEIGDDGNDGSGTGGDGGSGSGTDGDGGSGTGGNNGAGSHERSFFYASAVVILAISLYSI